MFGTPDSDYNTVLDDLKKIKEISPPHVSIYNMTIEENTIIEKQLKKKKFLSIIILMNHLIKFSLL